MAKSFPLVPFFLITAIVFACVNVFLGTKSDRGVVYLRRRFFTAIVIAYAAGLLLGPLGVVILTVPTVLIANRKPAPAVG